MKNQINFKQFRQDLNEAMKSVMEKYGLDSLDAGNISYSDTDFTVKVKAQLKLTDATKKAAQETTKSLLKMYGLSGDVLNQTIRLQNKTFKVTGVNTRNSKNPIEITEISTGKQYKCPVSTITNALK